MLSPGLVAYPSGDLGFGAVMGFMDRWNSMDMPECAAAYPNSPVRPENAANNYSASRAITKCGGGILPASPGARIQPSAA